MIRNRTTELLTSFGYPSIGISQVDSLHPNIFVGDEGQWVLGLKPGHFYDDTGKEKRLFASYTSLTSSLVSGTNTVNLPNPVNYNNSTIELFGSTYQYTPILEHAKVGQILSWTEISSGIYEADCSDYYVVGCRNLYQDFFKVPRAEDLDNTSYYVTDTNNIRVKSSTAPASTIVVDFLTTEPQLLISEILLVDSTIYPSYFFRYNTVLTRGTSSFSYSGLTSGGISNPFGTTEKGFWVKAEYYVPYSWTPDTNFSRIKVFTSAASDSVNIIQESGNVGTYNIPTTQVTSGIANFNPLLPKSLKMGYLFHHSNDSTLLNERTAGVIEVNFSHTNVCSSWGEVVQARVRVLHKNGLPIPNKAVSITLLNSGLTSSLSSSLITYAYPSSSITNEKGELILQITPTQSFNLRAVADSVTGISLCTVSSSGAVVSASRMASGNVSLLIDQTAGLNNTFALYTQKINYYGYPSDSYTTVVKTKNPGIFTDTSNVSSYNKQVSIISSRSVANLFGLSNLIKFETNSATELISSIGGSISSIVKINE